MAYKSSAVIGSVLGAGVVQLFGQCSTEDSSGSSSGDFVYAAKVSESGIIKEIKPPTNAP